jgi:hypothetical protein
VSVPRRMESAGGSGPCGGVAMTDSVAGVTGWESAGRAGGAGRGQEDRLDDEGDGAENERDSVGCFGRGSCSSSLGTSDRPLRLLKKSACVGAPAGHPTGMFAAQLPILLSTLLQSASSQYAFPSSRSLSPSSSATPLSLHSEQYTVSDWRTCKVANERQSEMRRNPQRAHTSCFSQTKHQSVSIVGGEGKKEGRDVD